MYFDQFVEKISQYKPNPASNVEYDFSELSSDAFKLGIQSAYSTMDPNQLSIFIKNNIGEIVNDIHARKIPYIGYFKDGKFIDAFARAIASIPISYNVRYACNNLAYDYFTSDNSIPEIKQKYLHISRIVNRAEINRLLTLGLDENTASNLALCRYSSKEENTNIKRLNFALYFKDPEVMDVQKIVWIYEKLFDRITDVFLSVMFETYTEEEENAFGENFIEVYGRVGLAVLTIVNNMTTANIKTLLCVYHEAWKSKRCRIRFSLKCLSNDYGRIRMVVENLANEHNIYIP